MAGPCPAAFLTAVQWLRCCLAPSTHTYGPAQTVSLQVTCTATDPSGNTATGNFTVAVKLGARAQGRGYRGGCCTSGGSARHAKFWEDRCVSAGAPAAPGHPPQSPPQPRPARKQTPALPTDTAACCDRLAWSVASGAPAVSCSGDVLTVGLSTPAGAASAAVDLSPAPGWALGPVTPAGATQAGCDARVSGFAVTAPTASRLQVDYTAASSSPCAPASCATAPTPPAPRGSRPLAVGRGHICAGRTDGSLVCAGWNDAGQAGVAPATQYVYSPAVAFPSTTPAVKKVGARPRAATPPRPNARPQGVETPNPAPKPRARPRPVPNP